MAPLRILLSVTLLLAASLPAEASSKTTDHWIGRFEGDVKTGHDHVVRKKVVKNGQTLYKTDVSRQYGAFKGKEICWSQFISVWETQEGAITAFSVSSTTQAGKSVTEGKVAGGKVQMFIKAPGQNAKKMTSAWDSDILGPAAEEALKRSRGSSRGVQYTYRTYSFSYLKAETLQVSGRGLTEIFINGERRRLPTLKIESSFRPNTYLWEYRDKSGRFVCTATSDGMKVEAAMKQRDAETRQKGVLAIYDLSPRITTPGMVFHPRFAHAAVLKLELTGSATFDKIPLKGPGQAVQSGGGRSKAVTLNLAVPKGKTDASRPVTVEELQGYLAPSYYLDFEDAEGVVGRKAQAVVRGERNAWKAAKRLSAWISKTLSKLPLNQGFAVATDVLKRGEGDCAEAAVLLCAMARSAGIPARIAGGFALQGGSFRGGLFVFHVWTEVWTGSWQPLDPTHPGGGFDACHIRTGVSHLNEGAPEFVLLAAGSIARQLRIVDFTYWVDKVRYSPGNAPSSSHAVSGQRYQNRLLGFSLASPTDNISTNLPGIDGALMAVFCKNRRDRILMRPHMAEYYLTFDSLMKRMEVYYTLGIPQERTIDSRPAVVVKTTMRGGGRFSPMTCYVLVDDVVFALESNDSSPACQQAFEYILKTLKFKDWVK